jgi:hypothetical protein
LNPTVTSKVFDHTSVLKLIESVFDVPALAARETSSLIGNFLDVIDLTSPVKPAPLLPTANPVVPQKLCASSTAANVEIPGAMRVHFESSFQAMIDAGMLDGWPI